MRSLAVVLALLLLAACESRPSLVAIRPAPSMAAPPSIAQSIAAVSQLLGVSVRNGVGGVMITAIDLDGPAAAAGARVGDFIVAINGTPVASEADFAALAGNGSVPGPLKLHLWREGERRDVAVALATPEMRGDQAPENRGDEPSEEKTALQAFGLQVRELPLAQAKSIGLEYGLMVTRVRAPADRSRIMPGDVIVGVNQQPVRNLEELNQVLAALSGGAVGLVVRRADNDLYIALDATENSSTGASRAPEETYKAGRRPLRDTPLRT